MYAIQEHLQGKHIVGLLTIVVTLALFLFACQVLRQNQDIGESITPLATPEKFSSPLSAGLEGAGLTGQLISISDGSPINDTVVRLARVFWNENRTEGVYVLEGARSPSCVTDDSGFFIFLDVDPADYVVIAGDVYGKHVIISNPDGTPRVVRLEKGKILNIGQLKVALP